MLDAFVPKGFRVDVAQRVVTLTIDRPPVNALHFDAVSSLGAWFGRVGEELPDDRVRCIVMTGAGDWVFCAGADVKELADLEPDDFEAKLEIIQATVAAIHQCPVPVVAAVNGVCLGAGLVLMSVCDIRLAAASATFGLPEILVGTMGGGGHLERLVGPGLARWMAYTGRRIDAAEAHRVHLIDAVLAEERLLEEAWAIAGHIEEQSPLAVRYSKATMNRFANLDVEQGYAQECRSTVSLSRQARHREVT